VNHIKKTYCIDESRVYATGASNGGGFVNTLACSPEHGGQFAAFAGIASALYTDVTGDETYTHSRFPVPMLEVHGTSDPIIPYDGGKGGGGPLPAIPEWLGRWARRNKCTTSTTTDHGKGVSEQSWTGAGADGVLRHFRLEGHDHGYPGVEDDQIFITPIVLEFFSAHRKI
jgi:poly(3-hydroxybutyrate) depolymerase